MFTSENESRGDDEHGRRIAANTGATLQPPDGPLPFASIAVSTAPA
jgi:hypothetical protein